MGLGPWCSLASYYNLNVSVVSIPFHTMYNCVLCIESGPKPQSLKGSNKVLEMLSQINSLISLHSSKIMTIQQGDYYYFSILSNPCTLYYTPEFIPQFIHNKPAFHNCHIIVRWCWWEHCDTVDSYIMHSCTPSINCMAMVWFYILLIDCGRQVYYV